MDLNKLVSGITQSGLASGLAGGVAGGVLTSALLSKKGRKYAGTALKVGGLAAVGGLAWKAYQNYQNSQSAGSVPPRDWRQIPRRAFEVGEDASAGSRGLLLIRAMVSAAAADGHIDDQEKQRIFTRVQTLDLSGAEKGLLFDELSQPASIDCLAREVKDPETAAEVYAASILVVDTSQAAGRVHLENLAEALMLPVPLVREINSEARAQNPLQSPAPERYWAA